MTFLDVYDAHGQPREDALQFLFTLIAERMTEPEVNISATMPSWREHVAFVSRTPYRYWYLLEDNGQHLGYVSATRRNEIGIVLLKIYRGKGYGAEAVRMLMARHKPLPAIASERSGHWIANVNSENERSKRLFGTLGGRVIQITYQL